MSSKIFKSIVIAALSVFFISLVFVLAICYQYFSSVQENQLRNQTELAARGVALSGEEYFENLKEEDYRITWIGEDGSILYDSSNNPHPHQNVNHLERDEVKDALKTGYGEDVRFSRTLKDKRLFAAKRLPDGSVLRVSVIQIAAWALAFNFALPICLLILLALLLSFVLASQLTNRIVKPLNEIDIEHTEKYYGKDSYKEVEPLLRHIAAQRKQLIEDQKQIEKTARIRQEFTANVSHELKTPLHIISGYAELLEKGLAKEENIRPFAGKIRNESTRMTKIVADIIELTRLDTGSENLVWEQCDLYKIAVNAVDSLGNTAMGLDISISVEGSRTMLEAVRQLLYSIVYNLCDNAIRYNHRGGSVKVSVFRKNTVTVLRVKDTGIGIPEDDRERIFERFFCVDKSHSKSVGGTGLGLTIVKHAVMIHNGTIEVQSKEGEGTEFTVTLPNSRK